MHDKHHKIKFQINWENIQNISGNVNLQIVISSFKKNKIITQKEKRAKQINLELRKIIKLVNIHIKVTQLL